MFSLSFSGKPDARWRWGRRRTVTNMLTPSSPRWRQKRVWSTIMELHATSHASVHCWWSPHSATTSCHCIQYTTCNQPSRINVQFVTKTLIYKHIRRKHPESGRAKLLSPSPSYPFRSFHFPSSSYSLFYPPLPPLPFPIFTFLFPFP